MPCVRTLALAVAPALAMLVSAGPLEAKCTRLGFLVNDYGKEGPTKDAKDMLDAHIAQWAKERGIGKYSVGKKNVTCELFLDFIVFDEHTCKAEADVCWSDGAPANAKSRAAPAAPKVRKSAPGLEKSAPGGNKSPVKAAAAE